MLTEKYIKDIQILRGVSILLVLLFHFNIAFFNNGFLGVDVFFVISGFLMFLISSKYSTVEFYERRFKRILPAYTSLIIIVIFLSFFLVNYLDYKNILYHSFFALFLSPNIGYWYENSYFDKDNFKPLLHLWSLGIEIQFYLLMPLLLFLYRNIKYSLIFIFFVSLFSCLIVTTVSPKTSFFLIPFRLWEFILGGFAAFYILNNIKMISGSTKVLLSFVSIIILLSIPFMPIRPNELSIYNGHPGVFTIITCISVSLIIISGLPNIIKHGIVGNLLELIGKYSYSIYLIHFPIILLITYEPFNGMNFNLKSMSDWVIVVVLILIISYLMYKLIETKFNYSPSSSASIKFIFFTSFVILLFLVLNIFFNFNKNLYDDSELKIYNSFSDRSFYRCGKVHRIMDPFSDICQVNKVSNTTKSILLIGNSHADSIKHTFSKLAAEQSVALYFIVQNNPLMNGGLKNQSIVDLAREKEIQHLVLHFSMNTPKIEIIKSLVNEANNHSIKVDFIMPVPTYTQSIPKNLINNLNFGEDLIYQSKDQHLKKIESFYSELSMIKSKNFKIHRIVDYFCDELCDIVSETGIPLYFDKSHLTITGSKRLTPVINEILNNKGS